MPYNNAKKQISEAIWIIDTINNVEKNNLEQILHHPNRVIEVNIPIIMDNWSIKNFVWYRSQHNNAKWPYKWGIRFHKDVTLSEVKALSMWMSIKTAVLNLPLWGWKWWIVVNPKELSDWELERLSRWYVRELYRYLWPDFDIPAPDVNTNWKIMSWMVDEYSKLVWEYQPWSFTWKPIEIWWSLWREEATWYWWIKVLETYYKSIWKDLKGIKVIVQWFWNVWQFAIERLLNLWAIIIWISDSKWWLINEKWIKNEDIFKIIKLKKENNKSINNIVEDENIDWNKVNNNELLEYDTDVLVPAALENVINTENANNINSKIILELANGPITHEADKILFNKWVFVIPDVLANSWWVCVSYLEQVQNKMTYYWSKEEVIKNMDNLLENETNSLLLKFSNNSNMFRVIVYKVAIERIYKAMKLRARI